MLACLEAYHRWTTGYFSAGSYIHLRHESDGFVGLAAYCRAIPGLFADRSRRDKVSFFCAPRCLAGLSEFLGGKGDVVEDLGRELIHKLALMYVHRRGPTCPTGAGVTTAYCNVKRPAPEKRKRRRSTGNYSQSTGVTRKTRDLIDHTRARSFWRFRVESSRRG